MQNVAERYKELRMQAREFCRASWPMAGESPLRSHRDQVVEWQRRAIEAGLLHRTMPREYGGGGFPLDPFAESIIEQEFAAGGVPYKESTSNGPKMLVPALLEYGTEDQRQMYIPRTLTGEFNWCQGYSEPGAGSDLASLSSKAVLDGNEWVITGQKVWTSFAHEANMMFGLFRTEPDESRHKGISFLILPMDLPGIDVRPLRTLHGAVDFCEVFFTDVRVPSENIVGARGQGWLVSRSVLKYERAYLADSSALEAQLNSLIDFACQLKLRGSPTTESESALERLAALQGWVESARYSNARAISAIQQGRDSEVAGELMIGKLLGTKIQEWIAELALDLIGSAGLIEPKGEEISVEPYMPAQPTNGDWLNLTFASLGTAIGGGTSNIQRNIIAEQLLGLPREPRSGS